MSACVYRFYDADDNLLYVGVTSFLPQRLNQHARRDGWPEVRRVTVSHYDTRVDAEAAEQTAIATEVPAWNIRGTGRRPPRRPKRQSLPVGGPIEYAALKGPIRHFLRTCGMTMEQLAEAILVPHDSLSDAINGDRIGWDMGNDIANALGVSLDAVIEVVEPNQAVR